MSLLSKDINGQILQLLQPSAAHQSVSVSTTSAQSAAVGATVTFVELYCDSLCFVAVSANPTATATGIPVYPGIPRTMSILPGQKVAGILAAGTDTLRIVEML